MRVSRGRSAELWRDDDLTLASGSPTASPSQGRCGGFPAIIFGSLVGSLLLSWMASVYAVRSDPQRTELRVAEKLVLLDGQGLGVAACRPAAPAVPKVRARLIASDQVKGDKSPNDVAEARPCHSKHRERGGGLAPVARRTSRGCDRAAAG